ncbi:uncharacterized protein LOC142353383 isoform X2 [Convolutriloba macropyga]|uniref:uncharacterized protein LOC142353383 isoform X2 n=1 Tax=Convolutriloba macropyga TaxID=536237 RepID=UPI003F525812
MKSCYIFVVLVTVLGLLRVSESTFGSEPRDVEQEELCHAFCQLKCMREDFSQLQCVVKCYNPTNEFGKYIEGCKEEECKQESCDDYPYSGDSAPPPSQVQAKKQDISKPVGEKIQLVWSDQGSNYPSSSTGTGENEVVYSVESRKWTSSRWNFEALVSERSMELNYDICKFYRVAAVNAKGSKGYSKAVTFIPEQPNRLSFGTQYFDNGWILTEITWQLPSRTDTSAQSINSFSANRDPNNNLASWGNDAVYVMFVERRSCDSYQLGKSEMVPGLSGVKMKSNKFLLKLEAPAKRGCFEYTVKLHVQLECGVQGDTVSGKLRIDRGRPCAAVSIVNNPDCPSKDGDDQKIALFPFDQSENYDMILASEASAFYSATNKFAISVRWKFSQYVPSPLSIPVTVSWQKLMSGGRNSTPRSDVISGSFEHAFSVDPDATYNVRVSQGTEIDRNSVAHSIYVSHQLEEEYRRSLPTEGTSRIKKEQNAHLDVQLLSLTPSILTLLIVMSTFMVVLLIGLLSFVVKRKLIRPRNSARHRLMHCAGGTHGIRGQDPNMYYWWNEEQAALAAAQSGAMYDSWEVQLEDVFLYDVILQGSYGAVYKGAIPVQSNLSVPPGYHHPTAPGSPSHPSPDKTILPAVIKMLAESVSETDKFHFRKEVEILKRVGYHDNLLNLLACTTVSEPMCMVLEDGCQGDLLGYLRMFKMDSSGENEYSLHPSPNYSTLRTLPRSAGLWNSSRQQHKNGDDLIAPTSGLLESFAKQICLAMCHLSSKGLFHRDLACRNILLTQDYSVKVGDYSMVRFAYSHPEYLSRITGKMPIKWMALEVLRDQTFNAKSDVWSFGVVLYELCTVGSVPYANVPSAELLKTLQTGYRMEQPSTCSDTLYNMMIGCWRENPEERPDFPSLLTSLSDFGTTSSDDSSPHNSCLIQLNTDDSSSSGEQHHSELCAPPPPVPPKMVPSGPLGNPMTPGRGSTSGVQMGMGAFSESNTLSSSEAGSMKRKMSSPPSQQQQTQPQQFNGVPQEHHSGGKPRKPSANLPLIPSSSPAHSPLQPSANQISITSLNNKSSTNEIRESNAELSQPQNGNKNGEFAPFRPEQSSLKTFATRAGNSKTNNAIPKASESLPRKPSVNGSEQQNGSSNHSSSRGDLTMINSPTGAGSKPAPGLQSFGGRQTPISFQSNSNSNNNTLVHPDKTNSNASNNSQFENVSSKFI